MGISGLDGFLWAAGFGGHCALLVILFAKRHFRRFPFFSILIGFNILRTVLLFSLRRHYGDTFYSHTYWSLANLDAGLQVALIVEIAGKVFRPQGSWAIDVRGKLLLWLLVSFATAVVLAELQHPRGDDAFQVNALKIGFLSIVLNAELFAGMIALSSQAGLNWKSHVASIATGMAVYSFVGVVILMIERYGEAEMLHPLLNWLQAARRWLYLACELYWGYSLLQPEPLPRKMSSQMEGQVSALRELVIKRNRGWSK